MTGYYNDAWFSCILHLAFSTFVEEGTYENMKTIFSQYVLLRKHLKGHIPEANKYPPWFLLMWGDMIKMKIREERMGEFILMIQT